MPAFMSRPTFNILNLGVLSRLGLAVLASALVWAAVFWALRV
jgi:hypothetical protein